mmetsp:Transcript_18715/g.23723  ORF Transcript_18715/g.23723 Transcript_18715/m.23723 type:complete len:98 (+) Transcript_18715:1284-1577(+)
MSNSLPLRRTKSVDVRPLADCEHTNKRRYSSEEPINNDCWHSRNYPPKSSRKEVIQAYMQAPSWVKRKVSEKYRKAKLHAQSKQLEAQQDKLRLLAH